MSPPCSCIGLVGSLSGLDLLVMLCTSTYWNGKPPAARVEWGSAWDFLGITPRSFTRKSPPKKKEMDTVRLRAYAKEILLNLLGREGQRQEAVQPMVRPFSSDEDQGPD